VNLANIIASELLLCLQKSPFPPSPPWLCLLDAELGINPFTFVAKPVSRTSKLPSSIVPTKAPTSGAAAKYINTDAAVAAAQNKKRKAVAKSTFPSELVSEFVKAVRVSNKTTKAGLTAELQATFLGRTDFKITKVSYFNDACSFCTIIWEG
jgi:protein-disulfide isomerase